MKHRSEIKKITGKRKRVAEIAGVSETTVSRVYNHPETVSKNKVTLVLEAAKKLGYIPDRHASALRRKGTGILLFLEIESDGEYHWTEISYFNWFYAEILKTLFSSMESHTYQLRHIKAKSLEEIHSIIDANICDGILAFEICDQEYIDVLGAADIPVVFCHHTEKLEAQSVCATDNFRGGYLAGSYLKQTGHRKPVYVTGFLDSVFSHRERLAGFRDAFGAIPVQLLATEVGRDGGYQSGLRIVEMVRNKTVDCIGAVNDLTAIGVIHALMENNIRIPQDISVIGYDNLPFTISLPFKLATIEISVGKIYERAVELLIKSIKTGKQYHEIIAPKLVPGDSVR